MDECKPLLTGAASVATSAAHVAGMQSGNATAASGIPVEARVGMLDAVEAGVDTRPLFSPT